MAGIKKVEIAKRVEAELRTDPTRSDVVIAKAAGCSQSTALHARKRLEASGVIQVVAPHERTSVRGEKLPHLQGIEFAGGAEDHKPRISVPDGQTLADVVRRGIALEATMPQPQIAREIGIGKGSYRQARAIVLLSDRTDLAPEDAATVQQSLVMMNETRRVVLPYALVSKLVDRIWGKGREKSDKTEKRRMEMFQNAVMIVIQSCVNGPSISIPYLDEKEGKAIIKELEDAMRALRQLKTKIGERIKRGRTQ